MRKYAIVFVHGLAKKPPPDKLEEIWRWGLARHDPKHEVFPNPNPGIDLNLVGVRGFFSSYYADVFYGDEYETEFSSYYESNAFNLERESDASVVTEGTVDLVAGELSPPHPETEAERRFLAELERKLQQQPTPPTPPAALASPAVAIPGQLEIAAWLPGPVKEAIIKKAAMEAYYFLFDKEYVRKDGQRFRVREVLRQRLIDSLNEAKAQAEKLVIVSHSMGTMVAYDVLRRRPDCPPVETLFTIGSPLGVQEVQDELLAEGVKQVDFPADKLERWINVYDPLDPICGADPKFANDFKSVDGKSVVDVRESNWGSWRHTSTHYLAGKLFRAHLAEALQIKLKLS